MIEAAFTRIILIFIACVAIAGGVYYAYDWAYDRGYEAARTKYEREAIKCKVQAEAERVAAKAKYDAAVERTKALEQRWEKRLNEARNEYAIAQNVTKKQLARANADNHRIRTELSELRNSLAAYAAGSGTSEAARAPASDRAVTLGALLGEALGVADEAMSVATEATAGAESAGDAVRALKAAWPSQ